MAKKKQIKKIFEDMPIESTEKDPKITESIPADAESEPAASEQNPEQETIGSSQDEQQPPEEESPISTTAEDISSEDLLGDVRRSLIEEETDKGQKDSKWWRRIGKKNKR